ncbi:response regulator [Mesorhizobium atlanticum]|uniref:Response regulator n=1 Tax=Mesorhizobium atlanticum TaxID=2233532 RepID=A0A330GPX2_9HYPH|nr:response regulator [Mesorhizobium atlanticum]RAZ72956.1 response regulator [Mesorhizobium atlanticum]
MREQKLLGRYILIAEDNNSVAVSLGEAFGAQGAKVLYPFATIEDVLDLIMSSQPIDAAVLSLTLQGEETFVAAENLVRRHIPFVFLKGHNAPEIPGHFEGVGRFDKSGNLADTAHHLTRIVLATSQGGARG